MRLCLASYRFSATSLINLIPDSIYDMANRHFICDFAVKCDFSAISECDVVKDIAIYRLNLHV